LAELDIFASMPYSASRFVFCLFLCALPLCAEDSLSLVAAPLQDTTKTPAVATDSLRQGKKEDGAPSPIGPNALFGTFSFMIPTASELTGLRSQGENAADNAHMNQDAANQFDENDICFPVGVGYRRRLNRFVQPFANLSLFRIKNTNRWTVRDTAFAKEDHDNEYALVGTLMNCGMQIDISPSVMTVDGFQRLYFAAALDFLPVVSLSTRRTLLHQEVSALGYGYGGSIALGTERYLDEKSSMNGEIGFSVLSIGHFSDNRQVILNRDVRAIGNGDPFTIGMNALWFKFGYCRWF